MQQTFGAAPHEAVLALLVQVAILLLAARALAELAQRWGQPAVVGEILAGILLGPSLLAGFFPAVAEWVVPRTELQSHLLEVVALLGALFLLLITGLETDLALIRRHARLSVGASLGGIVVPFGTGYLLGQNLPDDLLADPEQRLVFSLFVATAMSISAIPVIAKVLMDLKLMRRDIGQAIVAAGMTDDAIGWMLLSVVLGLAAGGGIGAGTLLWAVGKVLGFVVFSFTVGRWLIRHALDLVQDRLASRTRMLTLTVVLMFAWGAITQALGIEAVFGAFVVGVLLGRMPRLPDAIREDLERIALGIFAPIFFAVAGLKVNMLALAQPRLATIALIVIGVASLGKVLGGYAGARWVGGAGHWEALSFGAGMNARGALEIIVATIGLSLGILSQDMFSIIVVMALVTSLMAPPALRWTLRHVQPGREEQERLKREELEEDSVIASVRRVLIPMSFRPEERRAVLTLERQVLERLAERGGLAATLLTVARGEQRESAGGYLRSVGEGLPDLELTRRVLEDIDPTEAILDELEKDYDLLIVATPEEEGADEDVFTPRVDELMRMAPCPTVVVKGRISERNWPPRRILVPTDGSLASRAAAELAFAMASDGCEVLLLSVVEEPGSVYRLDLSGDARDRRLGAAQEALEELAELGGTQGVRTLAIVRTSPDPEDIILELADSSGADLLVFGTAVRYGSERLSLGPRLERVLDGAACPVVVVNVGD